MDLFSHILRLVLQEFSAWQYDFATRSSVSLLHVGHMLQNLYLFVMETKHAVRPSRGYGHPRFGLWVNIHSILVGSQEAIFPE